MKSKRTVFSLFSIAGLTFLGSPDLRAQQLPPNATIFASGLESPRGIKFGPDGYLYVAEAGTGGSQSTAGICRQVIAPVGPYLGGHTARVSKISPEGQVSTVAKEFPSAQDSTGNLLGVADVAFLNGTLYALITGGGCSHGGADNVNGVARINRLTGAWEVIADISVYIQRHPAKYESPDDFEPDGSPYSIISARNKLYIVEPNHGQILAVEENGQISQLIDVSASEGHIVPTSIAERDGTFYVGNLNLFPIDPQWARILTISKSDQDDDRGLYFKHSPGYRVERSVAGLTTVVAVTFGPDGLLYALELSDAPGYPAAGNGKVVRVRRFGAVEEVVTGLSVPTGMTFGPDGYLYIANLGAVPNSGPIGQILRVWVP